MSKKRLLAILSRYLWPVDGGRKESLNHYFKELHETYGYEIKIMCFLEYGQKINKENIPKYISDASVLYDTSSVEKMKNLVTKSIGPLQLPFQCSIYYNKQNSKIIRQVVSQWKPDVIFTEMIRTCVYYNDFEESNALLISNLDDLLSERYKRQARSGKSRASFAGSYSNKISGHVERILNKGFIKKKILEMEAKRCYKWEKQYYHLFDYTLMTSDMERDKLNAVMKGHKAKTLSVGIDYEYYSQDIKICKDEAGLSYIGNFNVAANADTLEMIINEILPHINSNYHFYIIGSCPNSIKEKYRKNKRLIFCGRVDDLRIYVKKTAVFLAPIAYGTGVKTKIVEAMAMNMPVVTNSIGAEGIYAENKKEYLVIDDPINLAAAVDDLLTNKRKANELGVNAGKFAYEHFRWDKVLEIFKELGV